MLFLCCSFPFPILLHRIKAVFQDIEKEHAGASHAIMMKGFEVLENWKNGASYFDKDKLNYAAVARYTMPNKEGVAMSWKIGLVRTSDSTLEFKAAHQLGNFWPFD